MPTTIKEKLKLVGDRIATAAGRAGRPASSIKLIAVSKMRPASDIIEAMTTGQHAFGENYAQHLRDKAKELGENVEWHFIGHLQGNKVKYVAPVAKWIHSIDSVDIATAINEKAPRVVNGLIEVNIAEETSKTGVKPEELPDLIKELNRFERISLKGLMCMPPYSEDPETSRPYFKKLANLLTELSKASIYKAPLTELSMGMSGDLEVAIEEGSTMVRIGTAIFGERESSR